MTTQQKKTLQDAKEEQRMYYEMLEDDLRIDVKKRIPHPPIAISYGKHSIITSNGKKEYETPIATYGNFSFIQAPPKSFKSYFVSLLASAYLKSQNRFVGNEFIGHRDGKRVLHFDTEQGNWHSQRTFRRVFDMSSEPEDYHTYALRPLSYKDRMGFIEHKIYEEKQKGLGLVIIDGIADLVSDVNDIEQSNLCVQKLMEWTANSNCHIITVIHSNWGSDKPTGHLGSFCEKKAEVQIKLERDYDNHCVNVHCKRTRNFPFQDFSFKINSYGYPEVMGVGFTDLPF